MGEPMIELIDVKKYFTHQDGILKKTSTSIRAVDEVSMTINKGEIVGLVGESGSGKTTLARTVLGLTKATGGKIVINGVDMASASPKKLKKLRRDIAVVFQDPAANLDPRRTVGDSIMRPMIIHGIPKKEARARAIEAMKKVKIDECYMDSFPHQLSGGQQQRIAVARALVLEPKVMILDEPTSALDISVQAQVLNLLLDLQEEMRLTYLVITHDLNVIRYISDKIAVMYLGRLMEYGSTEQVFNNPMHPYTKGLMAAATILDPTLRGTKPSLMGGEPGSLMKVGKGCRLVPRCPYAMDKCNLEQPKMICVGSEHWAACCMCKEENK
jgi:oligopeptide/dipeptide ABC transporter ATP-binding protein